jgi:hypothetical protein
MDKKTITIKQARKILGKLAEDVSDDELKKEIKVAELLKVIYFNNLFSKNNIKHGKA